MQYRRRFALALVFTFAALVALCASSSRSAAEPAPAPTADQFERLLRLEEARNHAIEDQTRKLESIERALERVAERLQR
jgi:hypothetical protein